MQKESLQHEVISYYNEHVQHKVNDYVQVNPRIEIAWSTLTTYAPARPSNILEISCGIGGVTHRMNVRWPDAKIKGIDISTLSIEIATKLFSNSKTSFTAGILNENTFQEQFDLILLMDVYEHIHADNRSELHLALNKILAERGRIILTVPTPHYLKWLEKNKPETIQPVDEYITFGVVAQLARDTNTEVILYERKNVWSIGDYAHIVLERNQDFEQAFFSSKPITNAQRGLRAIGKIKNKVGGLLRRNFVKSRLK